MALSIVQDRHDRDYSIGNQTIFDSKVCYISSTHNTGWLYGDIRCALLMSTQSVADQPYKTTNYLPQGNFSDASQWTLGTGWSISGGQAVHNGSGAGYITSTFSPSLTSHKWYVCIVDFVSGNMGDGASGFGIVNHNNGNYNNAFGHQTLELNTTGTQNQAFGLNALFANTTGGYNVAVGHAALTTQTTANYNTAVGQEAGTNLTTGQYNTLIGNAAMKNAAVTGCLLYTSPSPRD